LQQLREAPGRRGLPLCHSRPRLEV
jgi:hypothetical protein